MASVLDIAAYILQERGEMTAMKLQKLVYYSQAWSLVWEGKPLFSERIEAWANGPVAPALYSAHRGQFVVAPGAFVGRPHVLTPEQKGTIDAVLTHYGDLSPHYLSELTHQEDPWKNAREGLQPAERSDREISLESMAMYYESLV
jgi:uncharacterized phage-associated protein